MKVLYSLSILLILSACNAEIKRENKSVQFLSQNIPPAVFEHKLPIDGVDSALGYGLTLMKDEVTDIEGGDIPVSVRAVASLNRGSDPESWTVTARTTNIVPSYTCERVFLADGTDISAQHNAGCGYNK